MSFEETLESIVRKVVREELQVTADNDRLLTPEQVAECLGYTDVHSVYRLKKDGRLTGVYLSEKALRFRNSEVQKFMKDLAA
jgi:predicted DNA-binding transcriptional regulator AlpA